jgi:hypothetical protein
VIAARPQPIPADPDVRRDEQHQPGRRHGSGRGGSR